VGLRPVPLAYLADASPAPISGFCGSAAPRPRLRSISGSCLVESRRRSSVFWWLTVDVSTECRHPTASRRRRRRRCCCSRSGASDALSIAERQAISVQTHFRTGLVYSPITFECPDSAHRIPVSRGAFWIFYGSRASTAHCLAVRSAPRPRRTNQKAHEPVGVMSIPSRDWFTPHSSAP
jgi:hypothetical protein